MSVVEYFVKAYDLKISDPKQPLFIVKINEKECHIPPEFCTIDGVPETIRENSRLMRDVLQSCCKTPGQKLQAIHDFSRDLFNQKALRNCGVVVENKPLTVRSQNLPEPTMELSGGKCREIL